MADEYDSSDGTPLGGFQSPNTWNEPKNPNNDPAAGRNMNYWAFKDRSGNQMLFNHERGYENMTFEHRTGSKLQLLPDGAVLMRAHRGKYEMVFGPDRAKVTGTQDIIVEGGASLRVNGEYNVTVGGDYNLAVTGAYNVKSLNTNFNTGCFDVAAKNMTVLSEGGIAMTAMGAATFISEMGGMTIGSTTNSVAIGAGRQVGILAQAGDLQLESRAGRIGATSPVGIQIQSGGYITATTTGALSLSAAGITNVAAGADLNISGGGITKVSSTGVMNIDARELNLNSGAPVPPVLVPPDLSVTTATFIQTPPKPVPCGDPATVAAAFLGATK